MTLSNAVNALSRGATKGEKERKKERGREKERKRERWIISALG